MTLRTAGLTGASRNRIAIVLLCAIGFLGGACSTADLQDTAGAPQATGQTGMRTDSALQKMLQAPPRQFQPLAVQLQRFYAERDFRPVWSGSDAARARAASVTFALQHADRQGLHAADYPVDSGRKSARPERGPDAALYDLTLTASLLRYAHDVRLGRVNPRTVYRDAELPVQYFDAVAVLEEALDDDGIDALLARLPPQEPQYRALEGALARYRTIAENGGWPRLKRAQATGEKLARRLAIEDPKLATIAHPSAAEIKKALKRFQARHGLKPDGALGGETLKALNVPVSHRIAQIAANMERWRWLPHHLEDRYIRVDVPDQSVDFISGGKSLLHSKAIIGEDDANRTPILRTTANAVIVNPYWDIPDDIAIQALLPHLRKNPDYLASRNMVLVDGPKDDPRGTRIDWRKVKGPKLPYQIREQPGPHNVLGNVMLDMPNRFDVYIHGTSNAATFDLDNRERSHGCVRVAKVVKLAELALRGSMSDPDKPLAQDITGGKTSRLPLDNPIPVYMVYWTVYVGGDGAVEFRPDRYDRDPPLIAKLKAAGSHRNEKERSAHR